MQVFSHNTAGGLFSSQEDALSKNPGEPEADLYSVLDQLESLRSVEGSFHFKLCYPEVTGEAGGNCNEWTQTSNPATDSNIAGYQANIRILQGVPEVSIDFFNAIFLAKVHPNCKIWGNFEKFRKIST